MPSIETSRNRMLALVTTILTAAALRASYPVTMPLTVSILLIAAIWPLKLWLDRLIPKSQLLRYQPRSALHPRTFFAALYFSAAQVVHAFGDNWGQLEQVYQTAIRWLKRLGNRRN